MKLHHTKAARKPQDACRRCGKDIRKGDSYRWAKGRFTARMVWCDKCVPRDSELTGSEKLSRLYAARESVEDTFNGGDFTKENLVEALADAASEARQVAEEYRESVSNMPDALQNSITGEELNEKAEQCDNWADELERASGEVDSLYDEGDEVEGEDAEDSEALAILRSRAADITTQALDSLEL